MKQIVPPAEKEFRQFRFDATKAGGERRLKFVISTESIDRMHDTIAIDGWKLANYKKNPVVLWAHDRFSPPVAKAESVAVEDGKLVSVAEFPEAELYSFGHTIYRLIEGGYLRAASVGFKPLKWAWAEDEKRPMGIDFMEQELLEWSIVPIPANPEALVSAKSAGIDLAPVEDWAQRLLKSAAAKNTRSLRQLDLVRFWLS